MWLTMESQIDNNDKFTTELPKWIIDDDIKKLINLGKINLVTNSKAKEAIMTNLP